MKNLIILILAVATIFLTWKTYFSNSQCCSSSSKNEKDNTVGLNSTKDDIINMNYFKGKTDKEMGINLYDVVSNFRTFTLPKIKDKDNVDLPRDRTDGLVTKSVSYDRVKLLQLLNASNSQNVIFHFGSLDRLSANKYGYYYKLDKKSVVQKPILILEIDTLNKDKSGPTKVFAIGKICPPPNSCP
ncbi:MAG: hypothetical protein LC105_09335 [Chitinophagales bacterium]|nr:hypothetical protein [Chitinophagales bacterium]MCZ2394046.1 hypothetical protein [Chitinophagales bacterium]